LEKCSFYAASGNFALLSQRWKFLQCGKDYSESEGAVVGLPPQAGFLKCKTAKESIFGALFAPVGRARIGGYWRI
jgi:hypothetical protein